MRTNKIVRIILAIILICAFFLTCIKVKGDSFDESANSSAVAGASLCLVEFYENNTNASEKIAKFLDDIKNKNRIESLVANYSDNEILYENPISGIVSAPVFLNVRAYPSIYDEILGTFSAGEEVFIIGEVLIDDIYWYKLNFEDTSGYVHSDFVLIGEDANAYKEELALEIEKEMSTMPESFEIIEDISGLDEGIRKELQDASDNINYCLKYEYPQRVNDSDYLNKFSILVYMLENYQILIDYASSYGLSDTATLASKQMRIINHIRENLSAETNKTEDDMYNDIERNIQESIAAEEAAEEAAREAARQASIAAEEKARRENSIGLPVSTQGEGTLGRQIADFAASWIGKIAYVWGGNEFYEGGGVDCSHFTYHVLKNYGLVHSYDYSGRQRNWGYDVSVENIMPGDLICYDGHVAIYYGDGYMIHAPSPGKYIEYARYDVLPIITIRRLWQ